MTHGTLYAYQAHKCRCDKCRTRWNDYNRKNQARLRRQAGIPTLEEYNAAREAPHGTESRYKRCRCEECRAAAAAAKQKRREARMLPCANCGKPRLNPKDGARGTDLCRACWIASFPEPEHGTTAKWKRGCRCAECVAAHRAYRRELYARRKVAA